MLSARRRRLRPVFDLREREQPSRPPPGTPTDSGAVARHARALRGGGPCLHARPGSREGARPMSASTTRRDHRAPRWLSGVLLLATTVLLPGCGEPAAINADLQVPNGYGLTPAEKLPPSVQRIKDSGALRVGIRDPKTGQLEGFDAEIGKLLAIRIFGTPKVRWVTVTSAQRPEVLKKGTVDVVIATYTITPERAKIIGFVGPYFLAGQDILVKTGNQTIEDIDDLAGKKVCTQGGTTSVPQLRKAQPEAILQLTDSYLKCADGVLKGVYDATTTDNVILAGLAAESRGELTLLGKRFSDEPYGIGIPRDDTELRTFVRDTLRETFTNGDWNRAWLNTLDTFLGPAPEPPQLAP